MILSFPKFQRFYIYIVCLSICKLDQSFAKKKTKNKTKKCHHSETLDIYFGLRLLDEKAKAHTKMSQGAQEEVQTLSGNKENRKWKFARFLKGN